MTDSLRAALEQHVPDPSLTAPPMRMDEVVLPEVDRSVVPETAEIDLGMPEPVSTERPLWTSIMAGLFLVSMFVIVLVAMLLVGLTVGLLLAW